MRMTGVPLRHLFTSHVKDQKGGDLLSTVMAWMETCRVSLVWTVKAHESEGGYSCAVCSILTK